MADKLIDVLTNVYGYTNRLKIELAFRDVDRAFEILNELSNYLMSVNVLDDERPELPSSNDY